MKKFQALVKEVETASPGEGLDESCEQLQQLVAELKPAKAILQQACALVMHSRLLHVLHNQIWQGVPSHRSVTELCAASWHTVITAQCAIC